MKTFLIRGVPSAIQQDGWWLNGPPRREVRPDETRSARPEMGQLWLLIALIALADQLVWGIAAGLSLAVFGLALVMAGFALFGTVLSRERQALIVGITLLVLLPLVELVQPLSIVIAVVGLSVVLTLIAGVNLGEVPRSVMRLWPLGVVQGVWDTKTALSDPTARAPRIDPLGLLKAWLMPLALGAVFVVLLLAANPIAQTWVKGVSLKGLPSPDGLRIAFWVLLAPLIWTVLSVGRMRERLRLPGRARTMGPAREGLINAASVTRALVLFNALFAVQTVLDGIYLYGGLGLPEGITYAEYAHRGAYPLVVTALLAGAFALVSRRWVQGDEMLRALLLIFVAQNVALVVSSLVRLELYIEVYGLTRLRMAAGIWMMLVAGGLGLIFWQVWQNRSSGWLMFQISAMAGVVLYGCAWVSFDATIARYNLTHFDEPDLAYLCRLGDASVPIMVQHTSDTGRATCHLKSYGVTPPSDWREWGFRNARARHSLAAIQSEARP